MKHCVVSDGKTAQKKGRKTVVWPCVYYTILHHRVIILYVSSFNLNTQTTKALEWIDVNTSPNPLDSLLQAGIYRTATLTTHTLTDYRLATQLVMQRHRKAVFAHV